MLKEVGHPVSGASLLVRGEVPIGAGLSSSAAIEVASALALMSLNGTRLSLPEVAKLCQRDGKRIHRRAGWHYGPVRLLSRTCRTCLTAGLPLARVQTDSHP